MPGPPVPPRPKPEPETPAVITIGSDDKFDEEIKMLPAAAITAIEEGRIVFAGAYHENRKKECLEQLRAKLEG